MVRNHKILLVRRAVAPRKGFWDMPGGFVEGSESPERCIIREFREELGVRFTPRRIIAAHLGLYTWQRRRIPTVCVSFYGTIKGRLKTTTEISNYAWLPLSKIPLMAFQRQLRTLRDLKNVLKRQP